MAAPGQHLRPEQVEEIERHIREEVAAGGTPTGAARKHGGRHVTYQKIAKKMRAEGRLKDSDEHFISAFHLHGETEDAAEALGIPFDIYIGRLHDIARKGGMGTKPVLPGFRVSKTTAVTDADGEVVREFIQQRPDVGPEFEVPPNHAIKGVSALVDANGRTIQTWIKTREGIDEVDILHAAVEELKAELPRVAPTKGPVHANADLLNLFVLTDSHIGMLADMDETREANYDLKIAEQLILDWFSAAIAMSPDADTAVFAQLGDLLHQDGLKSVTPEHGNLLDSDSRFNKIVRVAIRVVRQIISMLLQKHPHVHIVMASANHDPASSIWMRELLTAMYEDEPRITVDNSPGEYCAHEWGQTALFFHHGHRRKVENVDSVFASLFREMYGRCEHSYSHVGHLHSDAVVETNLMRNERHRTLAPKDAYAAAGGWLSKRDAKVITYHRAFGEVSRITLSPQMVANWRAAA